MLEKVLLAWRLLAFFQHLACGNLSLDLAADKDRFKALIER